MGNNRVKRIDTCHELIGNDFDNEYIIAAANHYSKGDGTIPFHTCYGIDDGLVIAGFRHPLVIQAAMPWIKKGYKEVSSGFITSYGRYVDRKEAAKIAIARGQITKNIEYLYSEDIFTHQAFYASVDDNYTSEF